jgi:hypothetical protein
LSISVFNLKNQELFSKFFFFIQILHPLNGRLHYDFAPLPVQGEPFSGIRPRPMDIGLQTCILKASAAMTGHFQVWWEEGFWVILQETE